MPHFFRQGLIALVFALSLTSVQAAKKPNLEDIQLGDNPTNESVTAYLKAIQKATAIDLVGPGSVRITPIAQRNPRLVFEKLTLVPVSFLPVLLKVTQSSDDPPFESDVISSINRRNDLDEESKDTILKYLQKFPRLIETVVKHDWVTGAEPTILRAAKAMKQGDVFSSISIPFFVSALAKIDLPEARKLMPEFLTIGPSFIMARAYGNVPDVDAPWLNMPAVVTEAWKKAQSENNDPFDYAPIAAEYGHTDALVLMAKKLNSTPDPHNRLDSRIRETCRKSIVKLLPSDLGDDEQQVKFILDNRTKLVFDKAIKEYKLAP